ncbi:Serine-enriched protein [Halotydeus destructor]|nr:Serine-enriched protein [Halotydeus destructor]
MAAGGGGAAQGPSGLVPSDSAVFDLDDEDEQRELSALMANFDQGDPYEDIVESVQFPATSLDDELTDHEYENDSSIYDNKSGLGDDMKFLASMPELCDVTFLVGETREPVCAVKAILACRSRVFHKLLYKNSSSTSPVPSSLAPAGHSSGHSASSSREPSQDDEKSSLVVSSIQASATSSSGQSGPSGDPLSTSSVRSSGSKKSSKNKKLKDTSKDMKLKLFLKRGSEPVLNGLPVNQQPKPQVQTHQTMIIEEFEPDVFRQLIEYVHTGCVTLQARTLLGLMNAADYYGLDELRRSCISFVTLCITVDTVCALLASAERYIQYKCTKSLVQRVLEFVDHHGNEVLSLGSFALLPEHVVRLILSREELNADELTKFQAALNWSQRYCDQDPGSTDLRDIISNFFECIEFYKIPATVLMREVHPLGVVPDAVIMNALAFQADPAAVDMNKVESPNRSRRMTLPHTLHLAASDLHALRQSSPHFRTERSASTSTSGYGTCSNDSNAISLAGHMTVHRDSLSGGDRSTSPDDRKDKTGPKKEKEKDRIARYLANGKRRASRPFRRAKTLLDSHLGSGS